MEAQTAVFEALSTELKRSEDFLKLSAVFYAGGLEALSTELTGSIDLHKKYIGIIMLGCISSISEPTSIQAFGCLLTFLTHRSPKIRKVSAENVYLALLHNGTLVPGDKLKKALEIISDTCWEDDVEETKGKKSELCALCNLDPVVV